MVKCCSPLQWKSPLLQVTESYLDRECLSPWVSSSIMSSPVLQKLIPAQVWEGVYEGTDLLIAWEPMGDLQVTNMGKFS